MAAILTERKAALEIVKLAEEACRAVFITRA